MQLGERGAWSGARSPRYIGFSFAILEYHTAAYGHIIHILGDHDVMAHFKRLVSRSPDNKLFYMSCHVVETSVLMIGVLCYLWCHKGKLNSTNVWYSACLVVTVYR
jgi:hypothetical protein